MTPLDLIRLALKTAGVEGVGQTPDAEDVNDVFTVLQSMVAQWSRRRWLVTNIQDIAFVSTGAQSYTIGIGGNFNVTAPDHIEAAYVRVLPVQNNNTVDFPLDVLEAHEDYAAIMLKNLQSLPTTVFLDTAPVMSNVFVYPCPLAGMYEIHLLIKNPFDMFASLTTPINLPPEYTDGLLWNLAVRIAPLFGVATNPTLVALAVNSLNTIRMSNLQIGRLRMPAGVPGMNHGGWAGHGIPGYGITG